MRMPTFETRTRDINTQTDACEVFTAFIETFTREDLYAVAEQYVRERAPNSSIYTFRHSEGGLMGLVIGLIIQANTDSQVVEPGCWLDQRLMNHYQFTAESIPPRMILREAVALRVRLNSVLADLSREVNRSTATLFAVDWENRVIACAAELETPEDAYRMSDEAADSIIRGF